MKCTAICDNKSILIIVIYRPPPSQQNQFNTSTFLGEFADFLSQTITTSSEVIITGDINIHIDDNNNSHTRSLMHILESTGLKQHVQGPTHYKGHTLDILLSRDKSDILYNVQVTDIGLSDDDGNLTCDHYAVTCNIQELSIPPQKKQVTYRKLKDINLDAFCSDIRASHSLNDTTGSLDELTEHYIAGLKDLVNIHAPIMTRVVTQRPNTKWYTQSLREAKQQRRKKERKWRHSRQMEDYKDYRYQCSAVSKEINAAKTLYYSNRVEECQNDSKLLHKITSTLLVNQHQITLPSTENDEELANNFGAYFTQKIDKIRENFTHTRSVQDESLTDEKLNCFRAATENEVKTLILSCNNSSCQLDPIPTWLLKQCVSDLLPLITTIVNKSLELGQFPSQLKEAIIKPHIKKSNLDTEELKNYRPVSNIHFLSKILEKLVVKRLEEHMSAYNLYDNLQSAYRPQHATETAVLKIHHDIVSGLDNGKCTVLASLDLSAAFDTVDHSIFIARIQQLYGVDNVCKDWFESYLRDRSHRVCINDTLSDQNALKCGVPQGSVLGARLYSMYAYPLSNIIKKHNLQYHTYADDTQIYIQCKDNVESINEAVSKLENCIMEASDWMKQNSLKINENKTEFIIFSNKPQTKDCHSLSVGNNYITLSGCIKILGVTLDSKMTLTKHISETCRSAYMHIRKIRSIRKFLTDKAVKTLCQSVVISRLDYCNSVYVGLPMKSIHRLQLAHNAAARMVTKSFKFDHITPLLRDLHWLPILKRIQFKILVLTFKILHRDAPGYLCELLNWYHPTRHLRSANRTSLVPSRSRTVKLGRRLMDTAAATLWNTLPEGIKCSPSVTIFKKHLKTYLFNI